MCARIRAVERDFTRHWERLEQAYTVHQCSWQQKTETRSGTALRKTRTVSQSGTAYITMHSLSLHLQAALKRSVLCVCVRACVHACLCHLPIILSVICLLSACHLSCVCVLSECHLPVICLSSVCCLPIICRLFVICLSSPCHLSVVSLSSVVYLSSVCHLHVICLSSAFCLSVKAAGCRKRVCFYCKVMIPCTK